MILIKTEEFIKQNKLIINFCFLDLQKTYNNFDVKNINEKSLTYVFVEISYSILLKLFKQNKKEDLINELDNYIFEHLQGNLSLKKNSFARFEKYVYKTYKPSLKTSSKFIVLPLYKGHLPNNSIYKFFRWNDDYEI